MLKDTKAVLNYTTEMKSEDLSFNNCLEKLPNMIRFQKKIIDEAYELGFKGNIERKLMEGSFGTESVCIIYRHKTDEEPYEVVSRCIELKEVLENLLNE